MDDMTRHHEMNKHINCIEVFLDVLQIISKHDLFREVKNSSTSFLLSEIAESLEAIKKLYKETYDVVCYSKKHLMR